MRNIYKPVERLARWHGESYSRCIASDEYASTDNTKNNEAEECIMQRRNYEFNRANKLHIIGPLSARARTGSVSMQIYQDDKKSDIGDHGPSSSRWPCFIRCTYLSTSSNHSESTHDGESTDNEDVPYSDPVGQWPRLYPLDGPRSIIDFKRSALPILWTSLGNRDTEDVDDRLIHTGTRILRQPAGRNADVACAAQF